MKKPANPGITCFIGSCPVKTIKNSRMDVKVNGITLSAVNYKESDRILNVFTLERGKITVNARGVRKANAKMKAVSEPFCFAECVLAEKAGRYTATEVNVFDSFYSLRLDVKKYYAGLCALEFTNLFFPEETVSEEQFVLLVEYLKKLSGDCVAESLLTEFFIKAVRISGYALDLSACPRCGGEISGKAYFSAQAGGVVCENCVKQGDREFSYATYDCLKRIADGKGSTPSDTETLKNCLKFFAYYMSSVAGVTLRCLPQFIALCRT